MRPTLFQGIAAAAVCGLALGVAMQPQLALGDDAAAQPYAFEDHGEPWTPIGWTGPGPAPDYVTGTDWLRPAFEIPTDEVPVETYSEEPVVIVDEPPGPPPELAEWKVAEAPPRPFPSEGGDILAGVGLPPPEPPAPFPGA